MRCNELDEIIEKYIIESYYFTFNIDGFCIYDKTYGHHIILSRMIKDINRVFPDMNVDKICTEWWIKNKETVLFKINNYLNNFTLIETNNQFIWSLVNKFGKEFDIKGLMDILPNHYNIYGVCKFYDNWITNKKIEECEKIIKNS